VREVAVADPFGQQVPRRPDGADGRRSRSGDLSPNTCMTSECSSLVNRYQAPSCRITVESIVPKPGARRTSIQTCGSLNVTKSRVVATIIRL
jgi:hypothetical protein